MSGILESIVRRRRASASSRLGPPSANGLAQPNGTGNGAAPVNGLQHPTVIFHALQAVALAGNGGGEAAPAPVLEPQAAPAPVLEPQTAPESPIQVEPDPGATQEFDIAAPVQAPVVEEPAVEPEQVADAAPEPSFLERGRLRRRARYLRRLREIQLRDIGGFMVELHRFERERPDLVEAKLQGAARTDRELRELEQALGAEQAPRELRVAGVGGACDSCGAVYGSEDRFCSSCGADLRADHENSPPEQ